MPNGVGQPRWETARVEAGRAGVVIAFVRVKRAWVEFLGEQPDPAVDRVET